MSQERSKIPICELLSRHARDKTFLLLAGSVSLVLLSIAASQILLAASIASFFWERRSDPARAPLRLPAVRPLLFFFAWTTVTALASADAVLGLGIVKKFFIFLLLPLVPWIAGGRGKCRRIYYAVFVTATISALAGVVQFGADPYRDALHRISGFMSQWMTYSGLLMLALVALAGHTLVHGLRKSWWAIPCGALLTAAVYLSQTRNALLGATAGLFTMLLLLRRFRSVTLLTAFLAAGYLLSPVAIQERIRSGFNLNDPNTRNRVELFQTAIRLIRDHPWLGVGPKNVGIEALRYRGTDEFPDWMYQHMHNNFLQIAAERGIPGLLLWLWLMLRLGGDALRGFRWSSGMCTANISPADARDARAFSVAALGAWVALLVAGLFEYNFGDSEVLTLFLFILSTPYASAAFAAPQPAPAEP